MRPTPPSEAFYLPETPLNGLAVYVHWPWCIKKCPYCDFNAHVNPSRDETAYFSCILNELNHVAEFVGKRSLTSIFFGGGTPSLASAGHIAQVIAAAKQLFAQDVGKHPSLHSASFPEVTLEVNPATYRPEMFHEFVKAGVTRFSIGVQSLNSDDLNFLGRAHNVDEALKTIEMALESGAEVSADFIYGLPNQNLSSWENQLNQITSMGTHHLSAYQLTIEPQTKFFAEVHKNKWQPLDPDRQADFYLSTKEILLKSGLHQYEISNFARISQKKSSQENAIVSPTTKQNSSTEDPTNVNSPLLTCKHNLHVWRYGDYVGVGAGAHGRITPHLQHRTNLKEMRSESFQAPLASQEIFPISLGGKIATRNFKMPETYIKEVQEKKHALYEEIPLTRNMAAQEAILNGLRLIEGIYITENSKTHSNLLSKEAFCWPSVLKLVEEGFLILSTQGNASRLKTTPKGQLLLDSVLEKIIRL